MARTVGGCILVGAGVLKGQYAQRVGGHRAASRNTQSEGSVRGDQRALVYLSFTPVRKRAITSIIIINYLTRYTLFIE